MKNNFVLSIGKRILDKLSAIPRSGHIFGGCRLVYTLHIMIVNNKEGFTLSMR